MVHQSAANLSAGAVAAARREGRVVRVNGEDRVYGTKQQADAARSSFRSVRGGGRGGRGGARSIGSRVVGGGTSPTAGWVSSVVVVEHVENFAADTSVEVFRKFCLLGPRVAGDMPMVDLSAVEDVKIQGVRLEVIQNAMVSGYLRYAAAVTTVTAANAANPSQVCKVAGSVSHSEINSVDVWHTVGIQGMETLRKTGGAQGTLVANLSVQAHSVGVASAATFRWHVTVLKPSGSASAVHEL